MATTGGILRLGLLVDRSVPNGTTLQEKQRKTVSTIKINICSVWISSSLAAPRAPNGNFSHPVYYVRYASLWGGRRTMVIRYVSAVAIGYISTTEFHEQPSAPAGRSEFFAMALGRLRYLTD